MEAIINRTITNNNGTLDSKGKVKEAFRSLPQIPAEELNWKKNWPWNMTSVPKPL